MYGFKMKRYETTKPVPIETGELACLGNLKEITVILY